MEHFASLASVDVNRAIGAPAHTDQTRGNNCDLLTFFVMEAMQARDLPVRRELHTNNGFWHYVLAHALPDEKPTENDIITDLNPFQGKNQGGRILHGQRSEVLRTLTTAGVGIIMVTLRSSATIELPHDTRRRPFRAS